MRRMFAKTLLEYAKDNKNIILVTGDLGFGIFDQFKKELPEQFINVGASELSGLGICVGLALSGKIPFFYSITPFTLYRGFEVLRNYINHEHIPVKLVGSGRDRDYSTEGFSHDASDDKEILKCFPNIKGIWPKQIDEVPVFLKYMIQNKDPYYLNLER